MISHFAFHSQREYLDRENILNRYGEFLHREWSKIPAMKEIDDAVQTVLADIENRKAEIMQVPVPYKTVPVPAKKRWKLRYKKFIKSLRRWDYKLKNKKYIVG